MATNSDRHRLVIVESPTKVKTIAGYLGDGFVVESSRGHVRDLPTGASEVPAKYKGEKWARTGIDVEHDFAPIYVVSPDKKATIKQLKHALSGADELLLATDDDREGEAIAWHLLEELKPKVPVRRMVFHEITRNAINEALRESPRPGHRQGRRPGDPAHPGPALRLRGLPGAVAQGDAAAVGRPGAVGGHPSGGRPGTGADRVPQRRLLGPRRHPLDRRGDVDRR